MSVYLLSAYMKLYRAREHSEELDTLIESYFNDLGLAEVIEVHTVEDGDDRRPWHVCRLAGVPVFDAPRASLLLGDAAHNARCALDHAVGELVRTHGGTETTSTGFPIFGIEPKSDKARNAFAKKVKGVPDSHVEIINGFQPFADPDHERAQRLLWLSETDNYDKHRNLAASVLATGLDEAAPATIGPIAVPAGSGLSEDALPRLPKQGVAFESGAELWRAPEGPELAGAVLNVKYEAQVRLANPGRSEWDLRQALDDVEVILDSLRVD